VFAALLDYATAFHAAEGGPRRRITLVLAAKYQRPVPIILGVFAATLLSHAGAGGIGTLLSDVLNPSILNWAVVGSFLLMAGWILVPDKFDDAEGAISKRRSGIFVMVMFTFFMAEMGDKTQIVTVALAAQFRELLSVVAGTTLGMMIANVPVIFLGQRFADRLPAKTVRAITALIFVVLGGLALRSALVGTSI
jgi:putative Ca2+/H+ antiporter (TMEM165/GDT1 family)